MNLNMTTETTLADIPYEVLTGSLLNTLEIKDILHLGSTCQYFHKVALDEHFWRQRTLKTFRLPPQPIRQKGWSELYKRLSTAKVFTWGSNEFGRLGHSYDETTGRFGSRLLQRSPKEVEDLRNEVVVDLKCGGWSSWALTSSGKVFGWGKIQGDSFRGESWKVPKLLEFSEPIQRISVGRKCCLALAESGTLYVVDVDFTASAVVKLTVPDILPELPSKEHSVVHVAAGWSYAAAVLKGVGLVVWKTDIPVDVHVPIAGQGNVTLGLTNERNCKARIITRTETIDNDTTDSLDIRGLMVGDGYLVYLTEAGTVHRVNITDEIFSATDSPSSFLLEKFTTTPQLSYLSGSYLHFGLFNIAGEVLIGNRDTQASSQPIVWAGLQYRDVIGLSWGDWHALALCEDGSVLSWGKELRGNGCLGMGYRDTEEARNMGLTIVRGEVSSSEPRMIPGFGGMEDKFAFCVAAAGWHSAALVADFKVQEPRKREW